VADVKWIKITTDIFDDEKILLIESLPDSYAIITVWFKLLCLAGKQNNSGVFMMGRIAYTDKMLATIFRMKESSVTMALQTFQQFGMVEIVDGVITIPNWGKHQNLEQLEERRKYQREYQKEYRKKQKLLAAPEEDSKCLREHLHKPNVNSLEGDIEEEKEEELEIDSKGQVLPPEPKIDCQQIVDLYNNTCKSFPKVRALTDARKTAIRSRLRKYSIGDLKTVFEKAEASSFLRGENKSGWKANFDWLLKESSMVKVMEDYYVDTANSYKGRIEKVPGWYKYGERELSKDEIENIKRMFEEDDTDFQEEAEQLRKELQESFGRK
jgi:predicted phage replisome organizer